MNRPGVLGSATRSRPRMRSAGGKRGSRLALAGLATVLATGTLAVLPAATASAAPISVTNCNGSGGGSLPDAVAGAGSGDVITFAVSCPPSSPIVLAGTITISTDLTITGPGAGRLAVSGNNAVQVFHVAAGVTATISGITIENGFSAGGCDIGCASSGGGIENEGTLTVKNSTLTGNQVVEQMQFELRCLRWRYRERHHREPDRHRQHPDRQHLQQRDLWQRMQWERWRHREPRHPDRHRQHVLRKRLGERLFRPICAATGAGIQNGSQTNTTATATVTGSTLSANSASFGCFASCGAAGGGIDNWGTLTVHNSTLAANDAGVGCVFSCRVRRRHRQRGQCHSLDPHQQSPCRRNSAGAGCSRRLQPLRGRPVQRRYGHGRRHDPGQQRRTGRGRVWTSPTDTGYRPDDDGSSGLPPATTTCPHPSGLAGRACRTTAGPPDHRAAGHERGGRPRGRQPVPGHRPAGLAPARAL